MRIAQIAPLVFRVPPVRFGGTERIVSYLTEELVKQGHEVTLFASGDSLTQAHLIPCSKQPIPAMDWQQRVVHYSLMYEQVYQQAHQFDIIHNHTHLYSASLARHSRTPTITTLHGAIDPNNIWEMRMFDEYGEHCLISVSEAQRVSSSQLNWQKTIYHGVPEDLYTFQAEPGSYLAFLGRVDASKGLIDAIEIAKRVHLPLKIAGYSGFIPQASWNNLEVLFEHPLIDYVGELTDEEKNAFLGNALCLLFPILWEEPFGMVMIEAFACGTPVIAYRRGSVPEIVNDGVNGWIVDTLEEAASVVQAIYTLPRRQSRVVFEERFTARRMADNYLAFYIDCLEKHSKGGQLA